LKFEIKSRWTGDILFSLETDSLKLAVQAAVKQGAYLEGAYLEGADLKGADLKGAYLKGADLEGADLKGADLKGADLKGAYLKGADLEGADLKGADLKGADLEGAYLEGADLEGAYLEGAYLKGAYLKGADLEGAYLEGAYLKGAYLEPIKHDLWAVLCSAPAEVEGLKQALIAGKVDGSTYTGECACLVGTIANVRGCNFESLGSLKPMASRPAERFFLGISKGDTPKKSQFAKIALEWIEEWQANMRTAFVEKPKV
jgi:uncharacterized protein YjbI with pentapeptide repeats